MIYAKDTDDTAINCFVNRIKGQKSQKSSADGIFNQWTESKEIMKTFPLSTLPLTDDHMLFGEYKIVLTSN